MSIQQDIENFKRNLGAAKAKKKAAAGKALLEFANHTIGESQALCPVDTGALAASGTVGDLQESGDRLSVQIGHNTNYAAAVHERLDVHHPQGQAKYLETAIRNNAPKFADFLQKRVDSVQ